MRMRVLIADYDFFTVAGGGQTYHRRLVERNPGIDFFFFSQAPRDQALEGPLPPNATVIRSRTLWGVLPLLKARPAFRGDADFDAFVRAVAIAESVRGMTFDVVDVPSFYPCCQYLHAAFRRCGVRVGKVVLGLHGWMSVGAACHWHPIYSEDVIADLASVERDCYGCADLRYGLSPWYLAENRSLGDLPAECIDVRDILDPAEEVPALAGPDGNAKPTLWFVGRLEKLKGPDLFLELAARLPKDLYAEACLVGPDDTTGGQRWSDLLMRRAAELGVQARYLGCLTRAELVERVYRQRSVVVISSRYDTFNLAAMEAVARGCPLVLSTATGAYHFLREEYPQLPSIGLEPGDPAAAVAPTAELLAHYDEARLAMRRVLVEHPLRGYSTDFIQAVYRRPAVWDPDLRAQSEGREALAWTLMGNWLQRAIFRWTRALKLRVLDPVLRAIPAPVRAGLRRWLAVGGRRSPSNGPSPASGQPSDGGS